MAHKYEAHTNRGEVFNVTTDNHHDNHSDDFFKRHLGGIIDGSVAGVVSAVVTRFIYKGRH